MIVIGITLLAVVLFVTEYFPVDVTAILVMVLLMLTNIITPEEGLSGFSNEATITVLALLILSIGLQSTGLVDYIGYKVERYTGKSEWRILFFTILVVGVLSAFMNNTAIVAIFMPVVIKLAQHAKLSVSKFLMPLSFAAMIGGTSTIIGTSTNILVSKLYEEQYGVTFGIFEFSFIGLVIFLIFVLFMLTIGRFIIPDRKQADNLTGSYEVGKYLTVIQVLKNSPLMGKKLSHTELVKDFDIDIIQIIRKNDVRKWLPNEIEKIREWDELVIKANLEDLLEIQHRLNIRIKKRVNLDDQELTSEDAVLFEAVIGQNSSLVGKKVGNVDFLAMFRAIPLAIRRSGEPLVDDLSDIEIQFGDVFLIEARRHSLSSFIKSPDFIVMEKVKKRNIRKDKMLISLLIVIGVVIAAAFELMEIVVAALTGCVLLFITGCLSVRYAYQKMEWRVIFLLAGILPLGIAVQKTGVSDLAAKQLIQLIGMDYPALVISTLFLLTTLLTSIMSNNATAVLLTPIAINIAMQMGIDPKPLVLTVMVAASTSFLTPIGYQTNTLIYGVGQYTFADFLKVGGILTLLVWLVATALICWIYL